MTEGVKLVEPLVFVPKDTGKNCLIFSAFASLVISYNTKIQIQYFLLRKDSK